MSRISSCPALVESSIRVERPCTYFGTHESQTALRLFRRRHRTRRGSWVPLRRREVSPWAASGRAGREGNDCCNPPLACVTSAAGAAAAAPRAFASGGGRLAAFRELIQRCLDNFGPAPRQACTQGPANRGTRFRRPHRRDAVGNCTSASPRQACCRPRGAGLAAPDVESPRFRSAPSPAYFFSGMTSSFASRACSMTTSRRATVLPGLCETRCSAPVGS